MILLTTLTVIMWTISMILLIVWMLVSKKKFLALKTLSPFECGMPVSSYIRNSFSVNFFVIMLIFLIFDVELVILFPLYFNLWVSLNPLNLASFSLIILILSGGLFWEWAKSMLLWMK